MNSAPISNAIATPVTGRDLWRLRVQDSGDKPFLQVGEVTYTYAEVDLLTRRTAANLAGMGVEQETRILVGLSNRVEAVVCQLAAQELGAVLVALVPSLSWSEVKYQINHSAGRTLIIDDELASTVVPHITELASIENLVSPAEPGFGFTGRWAALDDLMHAEPIEAHLPLPELTGDSPAMILYTSGSTANPKGVVLRSASLVSAGYSWAEAFNMRPDDIFLLPFTVTHAVGALVVPGMVLATGAQMALEPRFSVSKFWDRVAETGSSLTLLFPAQVQLLLNSRKSVDKPKSSTLRTVISHVPDPEFCESFGVEIGVVWACTEAGAMGAGGIARTGVEVAEGYVGPALGDTEIRIVHPLDGDVAAGENGEIYVRHRHVMLGYLDNLEATADTVIDGWIATGDLGLLDEAGALFYKGRLKNVIKRSGENISPEQIEAVLLEHPDVVSCVVFGVPDPVRTEEIAAIVHVSRETLEGDLSAFVGDRLSKWKAPRYIVATGDELPRLGSGKLNRRVIEKGFARTEAWDRQSGDHR